MEPNASTDTKENEVNKTVEELETLLPEPEKEPAVKVARVFDPQQHGFKTIVVKTDNEPKLTGNRANNLLEIAKSEKNTNPAS